MIACTSISPTHINESIQHKAVESWIKQGFHVYSFNSKDECDKLKILYPDVIFIVTNRTLEKTFNKPYVSINAVFEWCKGSDQDHFCIINSDIEILSDEKTISNIKTEMNRGIVMANRVNYETSYAGSQYLSGIDVFFIHKKFLSAFAETIFCFGQCHWDYWIPYTAINNGIDTIFIKQDFAYHKNHNTQYSQDSWLKTGRYFMWQFNLYQFAGHGSRSVSAMSDYVYNFIYKASERKEI